MRAGAKQYNAQYSHGTWCGWLFYGQNIFIFIPSVMGMLVEMEKDGENVLRMLGRRGYVYMYLCVCV